MENVKSKIIKRLESLILEAEDLKKKRHDSGETDLWEKRCESLLQRIGGDKLIDNFIRLNAISFYPDMPEEEYQEGYLANLSNNINLLISIKEDLELFDEDDEKDLKKIKHKIELGANIGIFKGRYSQEREK